MLYKKVFKIKEHSDINLLHSIEELKKGRFDLFHPTYFNDYFLPYLNGKPFVITIHDMIPELYPQLFCPDDIQVVMKRKLANLADAIIAVSENTKNDIIRIFNIPEEKIHVVYHGCSLESSPKTNSPFKFPYLLYVGDRYGYKNFFPFVKQVTPILKQHKGLRVICTGHPFKKEEKKLFKKYGVNNLFVNKWIKTDDDLFTLYHNAKCFIYPSDYEGFGIPILEAYQADCPVLLNQASCFPEIAKDAAIYFNINSNDNSLSKNLEKVLLMNESEKEMLLAKQRTRLTNFSWKKSAEQLARIYNSI
jgi:glycosyltransferase involved in cell wall biosynthesis